MSRQTLTNCCESSRLTSVSGLFVCLLAVSLIGTSTEADQFSPQDAPPGWQLVEALQRTPAFASLDLDQASNALQSEYAMVRIAALSAITRSNDPAFLNLVIDRLQDPDRLTRRLALAVLTRFRGEAVDAAFLEAINQLPDIREDGRFDPLEFVNARELGEDVPLLKSTSDQRSAWAAKKRLTTWNLAPLDDTPPMKVETSFWNSSVQCGQDLRVMWRLTARSSGYASFDSSRGDPHDDTPHRLFSYHPECGTDWIGHLWHEDALTVVNAKGIPTGETWEGWWPGIQPITLSTTYLTDTFLNNAPLGPGLYLIHGDNAGSPFFIHVRRTVKQESEIPRLIATVSDPIAVERLGYLRSHDAVPALVQAYLKTAPLQAESPLIGMGGKVPVSFTILQSLVAIRDTRAISAILQRPSFSVPCTSGTVEEFVAKFGDAALPHLEHCLRNWNDAKTADEWTCVAIAINLLGDTMSEEAKVSCEKMIDMVIRQANLTPNNSLGFYSLKSYLLLIAKQSPERLEMPLWRLRQQQDLSSDLLHTIRLTRTDACRKLIRKLWQRASETQDAPEFTKLLEDIAGHWSIAVDLPK